MLIYEIDRKIIYLIAVSLSLFFGVLPMDHVASSLSKHGRDAQESDEQPAAKVQKTEHSVDVASHKMKKEVVKHFKEIAKSSGELNENLRAFIDENPNIRDKRGNTLLHYALLFNNDKLISFLIHNSKVDITICNDEGLSLLALAVQQNNDRAVSGILKKAPISGEGLNGFMLEVYALFEATVYLMNNPPIIKMFENFIAKNEPLKKHASLPSAMHGIQLPNYQKNSAKNTIQLIQHHSTNEQCKKFIDAKERIVNEVPNRLARTVWNYHRHDPNLNWREQFTQEEQDILCTAFSRGMAIYLLRHYHKVYKNFRDRNLFNFLIDVDTTLDPVLKNRIKIALNQNLDQDPENMQRRINLDQSDVEKLPLDLLYYFLFEAICINDKEFLRKNLSNKNLYLINKKDYLGRNFIHKVAVSEDLEMFGLFWKYWPNINIQDNDGKTPLHKAVEFNQQSIVQMILEREPNINIQDNRGNTPLHKAIELDREGIVQMILEREPNINIKDNRGNTSLHKAIELGRQNIVRMILAIWQNQGQGDYQLRIALHKAIDCGTSDMVIAILASSQHLTMNICDQTGRIEGSMLDCAVASGSVEKVRAILNYIPQDKRIDFINRRGSRINFLKSPLEQAVESGNLEIVQEFLRYVPTLSDKTIEGLFEAVFKRGRISIVKAILDYKQRGVAVEDNDARIALELLNYCPEVGLVEVFFGALIRLNDIDLIKEVLTLNFLTNILNAEGMMPIHRVIWCSGSVDAVQVFLEHDPASINVQDSLENRTPLHMAIRRNSVNLVKKLLEYKPDLTLQDSNGNTPLHEALYYYLGPMRFTMNIIDRSNMLEIIKLLLGCVLPLDIIIIENNEKQSVFDLAAENQEIVDMLLSACNS